MCGIAGFFSFKGTPIILEELKKFAAPISHRGPDAEGFALYQNQSIGFAHKRLSILDVSDAGKQPMNGAEKKLSIIFNGEIFNFIEIRNELMEKGHQFFTQTDTEVILAAYKQWGKNCFHKFNGMWAMAIYNQETQNVVLCRDRYGIKPLYYQHFGGFLAFASETNCFKNVNGYSRSFNYEVLQSSLENPNYSSAINSTIFEGIHQLPPGCLMEITPAGICTTEKWYNFETECADKSDIEYTEGDFFDLFQDAVKIRLRSDVPIATAFSGGLDSTAVFSMINYLSQNNFSNGKLTNDWQKAFCMQFDDEKNDDTPYAIKALQELGREAVFIKANKATLAKEIIDDTVYFDDLIGTPLTSISNIYKSMKEHGYTVSLDGHGADEYLFGYRGMVSDLFHRGTLRYGKKTTKEIRNALIHLYHPTEQARIKQSSKHLIKKAYSVPQYFKRLLRNTFDEHDYTQEITRQYFFNDPLPALLKNFDKASMRHGVEVRMPFMDYRLVEMCYNLPINYKIANGKTKWIVRDELKNIMPQSAIDRTYKIGIGAPLKEWLWMENKPQFDEIIQEGKNKHLLPNSLLSAAETDSSLYWKALNLQLIEL